jgi:hypothetical protein
LKAAKFILNKEKGFFTFKDIIKEELEWIHKK